MHYSTCFTERRILFYDKMKQIYQHSQTFDIVQHNERQSTMYIGVHEKEMASLMQ